MKLQPGATLPAAMVALTVTTGMVEAVSFLALGPVFTAVQTGNTLFLGFAVVGSGEFSAAASAASLLGFAVGAALGARLSSGADVRGRRWFVEALVAESVLLAVAGLAGWSIERYGHPLTFRQYLVTALVALAMGMRNVTTLRASVPDMPTTVITRTMTALIGTSRFGLDSRIPSGTAAEIRRTASVGAMFAGGLLGAWMLHEAVRPPAVLLVTSACVLAVALVLTCTPRHRTGP
ncbi:YoaK family protein [Streptomyces hiroshimensis]|uniref:Membrane protein n=1 Tax=Streptomyces hiroshimensis TaxID=66424 RepID=A0ABQ2YZC7_9ACTN|nr:YoaK family protein [Streptomyces hiroshimensis]GGX98231.1 membrane protein [Streptomyces hiroshimensis]